MADTPKKFNLNFKLNFHSGYDTSAETDWMIIFLSGVTLSLVVIVFAAYMFVGIDRREIFVTKEDTDNQVKTFDIKKLEETVEYYEGKAIEFDRIKKGGITSSDPSI